MGHDLDSAFLFPKSVSYSWLSQPYTSDRSYKKFMSLWPQVYLEQLFVSYDGQWWLHGERYWKQGKYWLMLFFFFNSFSVFFSQRLVSSWRQRLVFLMRTGLQLPSLKHRWRSPGLCGLHHRLPKNLVLFHMKLFHELRVAEFWESRWG